MLEEYKTKLSAITTVLDNMPKNNNKNKQEYCHKINETKENITGLEANIKKEIDKRYNKINSLETNPNLKTYDANIIYIRNKLYLFNKLNTSFEKSGLDKLLYNLDHFYKEDLININDTIINIISKFNMVGIVLKQKDFCYSIYAYNYMTIFFDKGKAKINQANIKSIFENIYWKCPSIIKHIELNFQMLYRRNIKLFDEYFRQEKIKYLSETNKTEEQIKIKFSELIVDQNCLINVDSKIILNDFINNGWDIKQYENLKILKLYEKYVEDKKTSLEEYKIYNSDLNNLLHSLEEYRSYAKFKFIIDDIMIIYNEKDKYKNITKIDLKNINKNESQLKKLNFRYNKKSLFGKSDDKKGELLLKINSIVLETSTLYDTYELNQFKEKIVTNLTDVSTVYDLLSLAFSNYNYLVLCIKNKYEGITEQEINKIVTSLEEFLINPYNNMINNITISGATNIPTIISNHYKMFNINIPIDSINEESVNGLISEIEIVLRFNNILKSSINIDDIAFVLEVQKNVLTEERKMSNLIA